MVVLGHIALKLFDSGEIPAPKLSVDWHATFLYTPRVLLVEPRPGDTSSKFLMVVEAASWA